jgi:hypothetical protein
MKNHSSSPSVGLSKPVSRFCAAVREQIGRFAADLSGAVAQARPVADTSRQGGLVQRGAASKEVVSGSLIPNHLRRRIPETDSFERMVNEVMAPATRVNASRRTSSVPAEIRAALAQPADFERLRHIGSLLGNTAELFEGFTRLRSGVENPNLAAWMMQLSQMCDMPSPDSRPVHRDAVRCFATIVSQVWQCRSLFPSSADHFAKLLGEHLEREGRASDNNGAKAPPFGETVPPQLGDDDIRLLAQLLLSGGIDGDADRCGFMPRRAKDPDVVIEAEFTARFEEDDPFLSEQAGIKCEEYLTLLEHSRFNEEWMALKRRFPELTKNRRSFLRSQLSEDFGYESSSNDDDSGELLFSALMDLLCWKYCLRGIRDDKPLLSKPEVRVTPYGTTLFIPAYLSVDLERDFDLSYVKRLHKARGLKRQGGGVSPGRDVSRKECIDAAEADDEARRTWGSSGKKYEGETRMNYLKQYLRRSLHTDDAQIIRMISRGRKLLNETKRG